MQAPDSLSLEHSEQAIKSPVITPASQQAFSVKYADNKLVARGVKILVPAHQFSNPFNYKLVMCFLFGSCH